MTRARRLLEEGLLAGIYCGAAAAVRLAPHDEFAGKTLVLILPRPCLSPLFAVTGAATF